MEMLTPGEAAELLRVSTRTLKRWRKRGYGPRSVKLGDGPRGRIRYPRDEIERWIAGLEKR